MSNVFLKNVMCQVYIYNHPSGKTGEWTMDIGPYRTSARFYLCLNCKFAKWVHEKLFVLIENDPVLYQKTLVSNPLGGGSVPDENIVKHLAIFVNVILNFLDVYTYESFLDTSLLKSLVELQFKIHLIRTKTTDTIVETVLDTLNQLQKFIVLNCEILSAGLYDGQFYGYPMFFPVDSIENDVKNLLTDIGPTYLYNPLRLCDVDRFLLNNAVMGSVDPISKELSRIRITLPSCVERTFLLRDIGRQVQGTDSLEVIHWYQSVVYNSILKLLYTKLYYTLDDQGRIGEEEIIDGFQILGFMLNNDKLLPEPLIEYFKLMKNQENEGPSTRASVEDEEWAKFTAYLKANYVENSENTTSDFSDFKIDLNDELQHKSDMGLEQFLDEIIGKFNDCQCFVRLYEFFTFKRYTYSATENTEKLRTFVNEKLCTNYTTLQNASVEPSVSLPDASTPSNNLRSDTKNGRNRDRGCDLVYILHRFLIESFVVLYNNRTNEKHVNEKHFLDVAANVNSVVRYLRVFDDHFDWIPLKGMASNLIDIWTLSDNWFKDNRSYSETYRFVYLFMAELNGFGIEHCKPPGYNHLSFGNVDFDGIGLHENARRDVMSIFEGRVSALNPLSADPPMIKVLIDLFEEKSYFIDSYSIVVRLYWKGELKTVIDIYRSLISSVPSVIYVYAFLDVYLKFSIAVIFYQTLELFARYRFFGSANSNFGKNKNPYTNLSKQLKEMESKILAMELFPKRLHGTVNYYNLFLKNEYFNALKLNGSEPTVYFTTINITDELSADLSSFGIFIDPRSRNIYYSTGKGIFPLRKNQAEDNSRIIRSNLTYESDVSETSGVIIRVSNDFRDDLNTFNTIVNGVLDDIKQLNVKY